MSEVTRLYPTIAKHDISRNQIKTFPSLSLYRFKGRNNSLLTFHFSNASHKCVAFYGGGSVVVYSLFNVPPILCLVIDFLFIT